MPFDVLEKAILHRFGLATGWSGGGEFFPQFVLGLLLGSFWQCFACCRWPAQPARSWGFYLGVVLVFAMLFFGLRHHLTEQYEFWPVAGSIAGLALGGIAGWIVVLPLAVWIRESVQGSLPALWRIAVAAALVIALLPLSPPATLAHPTVADWNLSEQVYQLLKPIMLWAAMGMVCGISGYGRQTRAGGSAAVFGFLVCTSFATENFRFEDVVEVMALLPGLALGLGLGERSRLAGEFFQVGNAATLATVDSAAVLTPAGTMPLYEASASSDQGGSGVPSESRRALAQGNYPDSKANGHGNDADNETRRARSLTPVPPLMEQLANTLSQQAGKCRVIPRGEGHGSTLREFHVNHKPRRTTPLPPVSATGIFSRRAFALMILVAVGWALLDFPRWSAPLAGGFVLYIALLLRYPKAWLVIVPAALPLFDLAFWTGRFFLDEFDLLLAVTMAALLWRTPVERTDSARPLPVVWVSVLLASVLISGLIGLLPLQPLDANAFASYFSHYNSLRVAKGFLWGVVLFVMLRPHLDKVQSTKLFAMGMLIGLAGVALSALWEYWRFSGSSTPFYRVTATFSSMHIGGGHIEAYLVFALPFTWLLLWQEKRIWIKAIAMSVFILAIYALITTVARGGMVALAVVFLILAIGVWRSLLVRGVSRSLRYTTGALLVSGMLVAIVGMGSATYLQQRFSQTEMDAQTRFSHWSKSINLLQNSWNEQLFGAGLGRFPERYFYANFNSAMGSYRYQTEADNHYLSLNSGGTLYMAQSVAVSPDTSYTLEIDVRSNDQSKSLDIAICEKKLFNSHLCQWLNLPVTPEKNWQHQKIAFFSGQVGQGAWWLRRPVQLSLYNPQEKGVVDVDNLRLNDSSGINLIANGDFAQGGDHWFFKSGNHLAWHTKSMWVHLIFEQGLMGWAIFFVLTVVAARQLTRSIWAGNPQATVWLASLGGLLTVGFADSLFDAPRLAMLLVIALLVGTSCHTRHQARKV